MKTRKYNIEKPYVAKMERIIRGAIRRADCGRVALVAGICPGVYIPLECIQGADMDYSRISLDHVLLGNKSIIGRVAGDAPDPGTPTVLSVPLADIAWCKYEFRTEE
jgi:hypothetical protein